MFLFQDKLLITQQDILNLLETTKPALSPKEKQKYDIMYDHNFIISNVLIIFHSFHGSQNNLLCYRYQEFITKSIPDITSQKVTFA